MKNTQLTSYSSGIFGGLALVASQSRVPGSRIPAAMSYAGYSAGKHLHRKIWFAAHLTSVVRAHLEATSVLVSIRENTGGRAMKSLLLIALTVVATYAGQSVADDTKNDLGRLQGHWVA